MFFFFLLSIQTIFFFILKKKLPIGQPILMESIECTLNNMRFVNILSLYLFKEKLLDAAAAERRYSNGIFCFMNKTSVEIDIKCAWKFFHFVSRDLRATSGTFEIMLSLMRNRIKKKGVLNLWTDVLWHFASYVEWKWLWGAYNRKQQVNWTKP